MALSIRLQHDESPLTVKGRCECGRPTRHTCNACGEPVCLYCAHDNSTLCPTCQELAGDDDYRRAG